MDILRTTHQPLTWRFVAILTVTLFIVACGDGQESSPAAGLSERVRDLPGISQALDELPDTITDLGLPDLSQIANLPQLADLPVGSAPEGGIIFNGPTEYKINIGEFVPGTDIQLLSIGDGSAIFSIAGMRSERRVGDSLDFDGGWPGLPGTGYNLRTRLYRVGSDSIRAAGVQQLIIEDIAPVEVDAELGNHTMRLPYSAGADVGESYKGMTLSYRGSHERGGEIAGLPQGDYPYRKVGDSIRWQGLLRSDIPVSYAVRMVSYGNSAARIGGIVTVSLPNH